MGQRNSTQKPASKFQSPTEASNKHAGTFQGGKSKEIVTVGGPSFGSDRGCSSTITQYGTTEEQAIFETQGKEPSSKQDYFSDDVTASNLHPLLQGTCTWGSNDHVRKTFLGTSGGCMYPRDARVVAPLRGACTRSLMPILHLNVLIQASHEVDFEDNGIGLNEAPVQGERMVRFFVENMEDDVPTELVKIENN